MTFQNNGLKRDADSLGAAGKMKRLPPQISAFAMTETPIESPTNAVASSPPEATNAVSTKPTRIPLELPSTPYWVGWQKEKSSTSTSTWVTETKILSEGGSTPPADLPPTPSSAWDQEGGRRQLGPMYAGAVLAPIVALGIVAGLILACLRRRKQRNKARAAQMINAQEMTMRSRPSVHAYMAPSAAVSTHFSTSPTVPQPVILGPIPSGENGAYLTGIDTSDAISVVSDGRPSNPFADNHSIAEPPPPYRPRSVAPPSFVSASRQSSLRVPTPPPSTSQTRLIEPSPFDDPPVDDDAISELSEPLGDRNEDAMSAVSDLSYQHDPVIGRDNV